MSYHRTGALYSLAALSTGLIVAMYSSNANHIGTARAADDNRREALLVPQDEDDNPDYRGAPDQPRIRAEVLNSGPVHEAYAAPVAFDPQPGMEIPRKPPEPIQEIPPSERPAGDSVAWISGYWSWDQDRTNFIWISGVWRNIPPERQWVPGYWTRLHENNYRWIPGAWTRVGHSITYLPTPPDNIDEGPVGQPPSPQHVWVSGSWRWRNSVYAWRPGYWLQEPASWVWVPSQYFWTPVGTIYVGGYWDYAVDRRGILFAPVCVSTADYNRPLMYRPHIVVDMNIAFDHCFVRPNYHHYYFGDYYSQECLHAGIYPNFAFHNSRYGYDPIYAHRLAYVPARDPHWSEHIRDRYHYLVEHPKERPQRLFAARDVDRADRRESTYARPLHRYIAENKNVSLPVERVDNAQLRKYRDSAVATRQFQDNRMHLETTHAVNERERDTRKTEQTFRMDHRSPIVSKPAIVPSRAQTPPRQPTDPNPVENVKPQPPRGEVSHRPDPQVRLRSITRSGGDSGTHAEHERDKDKDNDKNKDKDHERDKDHNRDHDKGK